MDLSPALQAFNAANYPVARKLLAKALMVRPKDPDALYLAGMTEHAAKRMDAAEQFYDRALSSAPDHAGTHYSKALLLSGLGRHADSMPHHDRAVQLMPGNVWAWMNRGNSRAALGQHDAAIADYDQCLKMAPSLIDAKVNRATALTQSQRADQALMVLEDVLAESPAHISALLQHSAALNQLKRFEEALKSAERAIHVQPVSPQGWLAKALALNGLEQHTAALGCTDEALQHDEKLAQSWALRGDTLLALDRAAEALPAYQRSLQLRPAQTAVMGTLAIAHEDLGQLAETQFVLEQALALEPGNGAIHFELARILLRQGDYLRGWPAYEHRWDASDNNSPPLQTTRPRWNGDGLTGTLLVWAEQGVGDQILHSSMLADVAATTGDVRVALDNRHLP